MEAVERGCGGRGEYTSFHISKTVRPHYLDVLEIKHVSLNKCISDVLISPRDE